MHGNIDEIDEGLWQTQTKWGGHALNQTDRKRIPIVKAPSAPSKEEVEQHGITLMPFKAWCKACVEGRAATPAHRRIDRSKQYDKERMPRLCLD